MTITVYYPPTDKILQRRAGTNKALVHARGYYSGTPTIQIQPAADNGTTYGNPLDTYANAGTQNTAAKYFDGSYDCDSGNWYKVIAREGTNDATRVVVNRVGVGSNILVIGDSQACELFYWSTAKTPTWVHNRMYQGSGAQMGTLNQWVQPSGNGIVALQNTINAYTAGSLGANMAYYPTCAINAAINGTATKDWISREPGSPMFKAETLLHEVGGDVEFIVCVLGSNDYLLSTTYAEMYARLAIIHANILAATGRTTSNSKFILVKPGNPTLSPFNVGSTIKDPIKNAIYDYATNEVGAAYGGTIEGLTLSDGLHVARTDASSGALGASIGNVIASAI